MPIDRRQRKIQQQRTKNFKRHQAAYELLLKAESKYNFGERTQADDLLHTLQEQYPSFPQMGKVWYLRADIAKGLQVFHHSRDTHSSNHVKALVFLVDAARCGHAKAQIDLADFFGDYGHEGASVSQANAADQPMILAAVNALLPAGVPKIQKINPNFTAEICYKLLRRYYESAPSMARLVPYYKGLHELSKMPSLKPAVNQIYGSKVELSCDIQFRLMSTHLIAFEKTGKKAKLNAAIRHAQAIKKLSTEEATQKHFSNRFIRSKYNDRVKPVLDVIEGWQKGPKGVLQHLSWAWHNVRNFFWSTHKPYWARRFKAEVPEHQRAAVTLRIKANPKKAYGSYTDLLNKQLAAEHQVKKRPAGSTETYDVTVRYDGTGHDSLSLNQSLVEPETALLLQQFQAYKAKPVKAKKLLQDQPLAYTGKDSLHTPLMTTKR